MGRICALAFAVVMALTVFGLDYFTAWRAHPENRYTLADHISARRDALFGPEKPEEAMAAVRVAPASVARDADKPLSSEGCEKRAGSKTCGIETK